MNVVFISSLSHSGSTLLDLLLGTHPKMVGVGELYKVLNRPSNQLISEMHMPCTCGELVEDCEFWSPLIAGLQSNIELSLDEKYGLAFDVFKTTFEEDYYLVDSSKYIRPLSLLVNRPHINLEVIHLIKDVRSFTISQRDSLSAELFLKILPTRFGSPKFSQWFYAMSIKRPSYLFWRWYLRNRAVEKFIRDSNLNYNPISYEELALSTEKSMRRLFDILSATSPNEVGHTPENSQSHVFLGNHMINDQKKMTAVHYDDRWQSRSDWKTSARLFPNIMAYNSKQVYVRIEESGIV